MPTELIKAFPLGGLTDLPAYGKNPGLLRTLQNMRIMPGGYAEMRGGLEKLKIAGGTATDPIPTAVIATGTFLGAHEHGTPLGWITTFDSAAAVNSQFSRNRQLMSYWRPFATGAAGLTGDATYFGSDLPFSMLKIPLNGVAVWGGATTTSWEYWNGAVWTTLTMTENPDFTAAGTGGSYRYASWAIPTAWVPTSIGDAVSGSVYKYWVRVRLSAIAGLVTLPMVSHEMVSADWLGMRELYIITGNSATGTLNASLQRFGVNGTTTEWKELFDVLFSGNAARMRFASYRGRVFFVNGVDQKKWDGLGQVDIGLAPPTGVAGDTLVAAVGGAGPPFLGAGVWNYAIARGYGPLTTNGVGPTPSSLYGYSAGLKASVYPITTAAGQNVTLTLGGSFSDETLIFRSQDLTGVSNPENFPLFLRTTLGKDAYGNIMTTYIDNGTGTFPSFPPISLRAFEAGRLPTASSPTATTPTSQDPPRGATFVAVHQNRLFLGYPNGDVYWSDPFQPDVFDQNFNYIRLLRASGGRLMGMIEFQDQLVLFTEDQTWGLTNVDLDVPQLYPIHSGIGCVAPESIATGLGILLWLSHDGVYSWDGTQGSLPREVSGEISTVFSQMSYELHGGSRAIVQDNQAAAYEIKLLSRNGLVSGGHYRLDFGSGKWSTIVHGIGSVLHPLITMHAPLGHASQGLRKPLYGQVMLPASDKAIYMGELTTQDSGTNFTNLVDVHFGPNGIQVIQPERSFFYYQAADGWGTPALQIQNTNGIWTNLAAGEIKSQTPDTANDYSVVRAVFQTKKPSQDVVIRFTVSSAAGGTVNTQRLFAGFLKGNVFDAPPA